MFIRRYVNFQQTGSYFFRQEVADAAKVLEQGDTTPKVLGDEKDVVAPENVEAPAPPSTPTKAEVLEGAKTDEEQDVAKPKKVIMRIQ